jgi:4-amino-4-deoxy-L-arabinose transferase-like glycosyltransferase
MPVTTPRDTVDRLKRWSADNRAFLFILLGAFVLRVAWLLVARPTPVSDWHAYRQLAADLIDHRQFGYPERTSFYLPMHPFHLAIWSLFSRSAVWLSLSSVMLSTLSVGLIYAIGLRIYAKRRAALIASALFAVLPVFVFFSPVLSTEHLFIVLMLAAMLSLVRLAPHSTALAVFVGVFAGLAILTRGEGVFYVPALVLFLWVGSAISSNRDRLRMTLLIGLGVIVITGPWYVRNSLIASPDTGLSAGAGINFYFAHNDSGLYGWYPEGSPLEGLNTEEANRLGWELGFAYLREDPSHLVRDVGYGTVQLLGTPEYALAWSTRGLEPGGDPLDPTFFYTTNVRFRWLLDFGLAIPVLLILGAAALFAYRTWSRQLIWLIVPLIASSWLLRTVIYWAKPRYGYFINVMLVFVAALAISAIIGSNKKPADSNRL